MNDTEHRDACIRAELDDVRVRWAVIIASERRGEPVTRLEEEFYDYLRDMGLEDAIRAIALLLHRHEIGEIGRMAKSLEQDWQMAAEVERRVLTRWWRRWHGKHEAGAR